MFHRVVRMTLSSKTWYTLPLNLRLCDSLGQFKRSLKTFLFGLWDTSFKACCIEIFLLTYYQLLQVLDWLCSSMPTHNCNNTFKLSLILYCLSIFLKYNVSVELCTIYSVKKQTKRLVKRHRMLLVKHPGIPWGGRVIHKSTNFYTTWPCHNFSYITYMRGCWQT